MLKRVISLAIGLRVGFYDNSRRRLGTRHAKRDKFIVNKWPHHFEDCAGSGRTDQNEQPHIGRMRDERGAQSGRGFFRGRRIAKIEDGGVFPGELDLQLRHGLGARMHAEISQVGTQVRGFRGNREGGQQEKYNGR